MSHEEQTESHYDYFIRWSIKSSSRILRELDKEESLPRWQIRALNRAYRSAQRFEEDVANGFGFLR
jgi:hypothetical protein